MLKSPGLFIGVAIFFYLVLISQLIVSIKKKDKKGIRTSIIFLALGTVIFSLLYLFGGSENIMHGILYTVFNVGITAAVYFVWIRRLVTAVKTKDKGYIKVCLFFLGTITIVFAALCWKGAYVLHD